MYVWFMVQAVCPRESYFGTLSLHSLRDKIGMVTSASQGEQCSLSLHHPRLWVADRTVSEFSQYQPQI